jgi:hypothetical protein
MSKECDVVSVLPSRLYLNSISLLTTQNVMWSVFCLVTYISPVFLCYSHNSRVDLGALQSQKSASFETCIYEPIQG